jgi:DNA polymerase I-like protein with 3'-5' exonuclease and polymerase domains
VTRRTPKPTFVELTEHVAGLDVFVRRYWPEGTGLKAHAELWNGAPLAGDDIDLGKSASRKRLIITAREKYELSDEAAGALDSALGRLGTAAEAHYVEQRRARAEARANGDEALAEDDDEDGGTESQATQLVQMAESWELFHTPDQEAYVTFPGPDGQLETAKVNTKPTRQRLAHAYYDHYQHTPRSQALQDALGVLAGHALYKGHEIAVHTRLAQQAGVIWLDLANEGREAVAISTSGWRIVPSADVPVKFRRPRGMLALPRPVAGGSLAQLHTFLNLESATESKLIDAWLIQSLRPEGPYPVLALHGEQGSAKSTTARILRALVDPNVAPLRSGPKDERDLIIAASNGWMVVLDNLSSIPDWLSDALCRLATGGGVSTRELYSDDAEIIFNAQRPPILTGITELATRSDLLDRTIIVNLPEIPPKNRRTEKKFWAQFDKVRPGILGALLDGVAGALKCHTSVEIAQLPRMADFATWATAAEPALGWESGAFLAAYTANQSTTNDMALETIAVVPVLRTFVERVQKWTGTASELLKALERQAVANLQADRNADPSLTTPDQERRDLEAVRKFDGWPKRAHTLSGQLRRVAPNLRATGITIRFEATTLKKLIHLGIEGTDGETSDTSDTSDTHQSKPPEDASDTGAILSDIQSDTDANNVAPSIANVARVSLAHNTDASGNDACIASIAENPLYSAFTYVTSIAELVAASKSLADEAVIALDCETTGLDPHTARLRLVTLSAGGHTYIIDTWKVAAWTDVVRTLLRRSDREIIGHNLAFDLRFLLAAGIDNHTEVFDTYIASLLLDGGANLSRKGYHSLKGVLERELGITMDKTEQTGKWAADILTPAQLAYAATDTAHLHALYERLAVKLYDNGLDRVAALEMATVPALAWMSYSGMAFDVEAWRELSDAAVLQQQDLDRQIHARLTAELGATSLLGYDINLDSPAQIVDALGKLGIVVEDTNEATLVPIKDKHAAIPLILAYREASKNVGTYGIAFAAKHVNSTTDRIHADFRQIGAASGRMACTNPNLQNIPRQKPYRACFRPEPGTALVKADYSQIELRLAAVVAKDATMLKAYQAGADLHTLTAASVLGIPKAEVSKEHRQLAKALNFGLIYGAGAETLVSYAASNYGVTITLAEAQAHRDTFFRTYPGLRRWHKSQRNGTEDLRTLTGRIRRNIERFTEKLNTPVQGSGADGIKAALARLWQYRHEQPTARLVAVVHDEVVAECPIADAPAVAEWLTRHMIAAMAEIAGAAVPIEVEATIAADWAGTPIAEDSK